MRCGAEESRGNAEGRIGGEVAAGRVTTHIVVLLLPLELATRLCRRAHGCCSRLQRDMCHEGVSRWEMSRSGDDVPKALGG